MAFNSNKKGNLDLIFWTTILCLLEKKNKMELPEKQNKQTKNPYCLKDSF